MWSFPEMRYPQIIQDINNHFSSIETTRLGSYGDFGDQKPIFRETLQYVCLEYPLVISHMAGWKMAELNADF